MLTKIKKWGNSQGIRIPKVFLETLNISNDDEVEILTEQEKIVIKKISKKEPLTIQDRIEQFYGQKLETVLANSTEYQKEIDWGKPVGKEIW